MKPSSYLHARSSSDGKSVILETNNNNLLFTVNGSNLKRNVRNEDFVNSATFSVSDKGIIAVRITSYERGRRIDNKFLLKVDPKNSNYPIDLEKEFIPISDRLGVCTHCGVEVLIKEKYYTNYDCYN